MRHTIAVTLIVLGGFVILVPVLASAYTRIANKDHIAEFYSRNGARIELPDGMQPAGVGPYAWACWLAGGGMVIAGVRKGVSDSQSRVA